MMLLKKHIAIGMKMISITIYKPEVIKTNDRCYLID